MRKWEIALDKNNAITNRNQKAWIIKEELKK